MKETTYTSILVDDLLQELKKSINLVNNDPNGHISIKHLGLKIKCHISKRTNLEPLSLIFPRYIDSINKDYKADTLSELSLELGVTPLLLRYKTNITDETNKFAPPNISDSETITQNQVDNYKLPSNYLVSKNYKTFRI